MTTNRLIISPHHSSKQQANPHTKHRTAHEISNNFKINTIPLSSLKMSLFFGKKNAPQRDALLIWRSGRDSNPRPPA